MEPVAKEDHVSLHPRTLEHHVHKDLARPYVEQGVKLLVPQLE